MAAWIAIGVAGSGLCWWLRADYLPIAGSAWAAIMVLLIVVERATPKY
jgi:hypothetical protein